MGDEWHPFTHPVLLGNVDDRQELSWWAQSQHVHEWHPFAYPVGLPDGPWTAPHQKQKTSIRRWRRTSKRILRMAPKALRPLIAERLLAHTPMPSSIYALPNLSVPWVSTKENVRARTAIRSSGQWPPCPDGDPHISFFKCVYKPYVSFAMEPTQHQPAGHLNIARAGDLLPDLVGRMQDVRL